MWGSFVVACCYFRQVLQWRQNEIWHNFCNKSYTKGKKTPLSPIFFAANISGTQHGLRHIESFLFFFWSISFQTKHTWSFTVYKVIEKWNLKIWLAPNGFCTVKTICFFARSSSVSSEKIFLSIIAVILFIFKRRKCRKKENQQTTIWPIWQELVTNNNKKLNPISIFNVKCEWEWIEKKKEKVYFVANVGTGKNRLI